MVTRRRGHVSIREGRVSRWPDRVSHVAGSACLHSNNAQGSIQLSRQAVRSVILGSKQRICFSRMSHSGYSRTFARALLSIRITPDPGHPKSNVCSPAQFVRLAFDSPRFISAPVASASDPAETLGRKSGLLSQATFNCTRFRRRPPVFTVPNATLIVKPCDLCLIRQR